MVFIAGASSKIFKNKAAVEVITSSFPRLDL